MITLMQAYHLLYTYSIPQITTKYNKSLNKAIKNPISLIRETLTH